MQFPLTRRKMLGVSALAAAGISFPGLAYGAAQDKRLVFIIQRGAADGLALLQPHGDPAIEALRPALIDADARPVDSFFSLHPAMENTAQMFADGEARAFHAVATSYRDRSHFDGQNILETGGDRPYGMRTGWLGRLLPLIPGSPDPMALSNTVPLALRGELPVATYSTNRLPEAGDDLLMQLSTLYAEDTQFAPLWEQALQTRMLADDIGAQDGRGGEQVGALAASLMAAAGGPRVVMIETGGWDTHQSQRSRLTRQLGGLDSLLAALRTGLGGLWSDTLVIVATEFGRTAAMNGTQGTDHGTASAAFALGGGLPAGDAVVADWPGLRQNQLLAGRDLRPTGDLLEIASNAIIDHFGMDRQNALAALRAGQ